jgi:DNA-binding response OmpR family regulator
MLTVESNQKIVRRAIEGQANDYLVKPISAKELRERIGKYLPIVRLFLA